MRVVEHSEFQDKVCRMITIKQFANNSPGFDVAFRPFFEDDFRPIRNILHVSISRE